MQMAPSVRGAIFSGQATPCVASRSFHSEADGRTRRLGATVCSAMSLSHHAKADPALIKPTQCNLQGRGRRIQGIHFGKQVFAMLGQLFACIRDRLALTTLTNLLKSRVPGKVLAEKSDAQLD